MKNNIFLVLSIIGCLSFSQPVKGQILGDLLIEVLWEFGVEPLFIPRDGLPVYEPAYSKYPYQYESEGRYRYLGEEGKGMSTKVELGVQNGERDNLGLSGRIEFSPISVIALDLNYQQIMVRESFKHIDAVRLSNISFKYNRYRRSEVYFWWDAGVTNIQQYNADLSEIESDWGGSFGLGVEWFFRDPLSFRTTYRSHLFGEYGVGVLDINLLLHMKACYLTAGWQNHSIDYSKNMITVGLGGYF